MKATESERIGATDCWLLTIPEGGHITRELDLADQISRAGPARGEPGVRGTSSYPASYSVPVNQSSIIYTMPRPCNKQPASAHMCALSPRLVGILAEESHTSLSSTLPCFPARSHAFQRLRTAWAAPYPLFPRRAFSSRSSVNLHPSFSLGSAAARSTFLLVVIRQLDAQSRAE